MMIDMLIHKKAWRIYDENDCGKFVKEFKNYAPALRYAERHSIYYSVKEVDVAIIKVVSVNR